MLDDLPQRVLPGLYLGSIDAARNHAALRARGVTHVLTVARELSEEWAAEFTHLRVKVTDSTTEDNDLLSHFDRCSAFIDDARRDGGTVLVHCVAGRSRSAAVCCAYLMHQAAAPLSVAQALHHVRECRPWAEPNSAFLAQLEQFALQLALRHLGDERGEQGEPPAPLHPAAAAGGGAPADGSDDRAAGSGERGGGGSHPDKLDEDLPWITVENLPKVRAAEATSRFSYEPDANTPVCCTTTDYAMQSVLLQINLKLLGVDGMVMKSVKQWVLRCSGCFTVHRDMGRSFCSKCGNSSLVRLMAVVDEAGQTRVLSERGAPARVKSTNTRGTKYSLPAPQVGRHARNLILAEDQLVEAREKARKQGQTRSVDVFDQDYNNEQHFGRTGRKGHGYDINTSVGFGKRNPNDVRTRPKKR